MTISRRPLKSSALLRRSSAGNYATRSGHAGRRPAGTWPRSGSGRSLTEEEHRGHDQIAQVGNDFRQRRAGAVADESREEAADDAPIAQERRRVPDRFGHREHPQSLQPSDPAAEQPGGEQHDEQRRDREEARHTQALAAPKDSPPEEPGRRDPGHAPDDAAPSGGRALFENAPEEEHRLRPFAKH